MRRSRPVDLVSPHTGKRQRGTADGPRVQALIFVCDPTRAPLPNANAEAERVLQAYSSRGLSAVVQRGGDANDLRASLADHRPRTLHFVGHAATHPVDRRLTLGLTLLTVGSSRSGRKQSCRSSPRSTQRPSSSWSFSTAAAASRSRTRSPRRASHPRAWETIASDPAAAPFGVGLHTHLAQHAGAPIQAVLPAAFEQGVLAIKSIRAAATDALGDRRDGLPSPTQGSAERRRRQHRRQAVRRPVRGRHPGAGRPCPLLRARGWGSHPATADAASLGDRRPRRAAATAARRLLSVAPSARRRARRACRLASPSSRAPGDPRAGRHRQDQARARVRAATPPRTLVASPSSRPTWRRSSSCCSASRARCGCRPSWRPRRRWTRCATPCTAGCATTPAGCSSWTMPTTPRR